MRWTALFFLILAGALATPVLGMAVALVITMVTLPLAAVAMQVLQPVTKYLMDSGMRGGLAGVAATSLIVVPLVVFCLVMALRRGLTADRRRRWFHILLWVVGLPAIIVLSWWVLPSKFG